MTQANQINAENRPTGGWTVLENSPDVMDTIDSIAHNTKHVNINTVMRFLYTLLPKPLGNGLQIALWTLQDRRTYTTNDAGDAAELIDAHAAARDCYVGVALSNGPLPSNTRVTRDTAAGLLGFGADIDLYDPVYKPDGIRDAETARAMLAALPLVPTMVIHSGHGIQPWWVFDKPWVFNSAGERDEADKLSRAWGALVRSVGKEYGAKLDSVGDLARLFRVAGTINFKREPVQAEMWYNNGPRYSPRDIAELPQLLTHIYRKNPTTPPPAVRYDIGEEQLIATALGAKNGHIIRELFEQAGADGNSEGDASLCGLLSFYSGGDAELLERLMRMSNRVRDKWDDKRGNTTWIAQECQSAIERHTGSWYIPKAITPPEDRDEDTTTIETEPQSMRLMRIARTADFFRTENGEPHVTLPNGETFEMVERGGGFRSWLINRFYELEGRPPTATAMSEANTTCCARTAERPIRDVALRIGEAEDTIYIDLANEAREVVAVSTDGWNVTQDLPNNLRFKRPPEMRALPQPVYPGDISLLRDFLNVDDDDFILCVAWLLATLRTGVPYPILTLLGEQGTAKSTTTRLLRRIVDAASPETTRPPSGDSDLFAITANNYVLALENISYIHPELSDSLSAIATGAGLTKRKLYTDGDTYSSAARRPIIMNGIGDIATRGDLLDRCLVVTLNNISDKDRIDERTFWARAEKIMPRVLGGLLTAASTAMRELPNTHLPTTPRMADFAKWVVAAEEALPWQAGKFMEVYADNRESAVLNILEGDAFSKHLYSLAQSGFEGTATELGARVGSLATERELHHKSWPQNARNISDRVTRLAPALRVAGIDVERTRTGSERIIQLIPQQYGGTSTPENIFD